MSPALMCAVAADGERIQRYVAGTLEAEATSEFEIHLLHCSECQAAVREGVAVRAALRASPVAHHSAAIPFRKRWWLIPAAAAAVITVWLIGREGSLARLGRVGAAPAFSGLPVRGTADSAAILADLGMEAYKQGRYRDAATLLKAAAARGPGPAIQYYQGLAELLAGRPRESLREFGAVLGGAPNAYEADAHFYAAKAWLLLGRADSALTHLTAISSDTEAVGARARALADSVKEVSR